jgi:hypothetical protein
MLWTIVLFFFVLWLLGFGFGVGGSLIHWFLVLAIICMLLNLASGRRPWVP